MRKFNLIFLLIICIFITSFTCAELVVNQESYSISNITREQAVNSINEISSVIEVFKNNNFSYAYVQDKLEEANRTLMIADYALVLINSSATYAEKQKASNAVGLISWRDINYGSVVFIGNEIVEREKTAFILFDMLNSLNGKIAIEKSNGVNVITTESLFRLAQESFINERYNETYSLIEQSKTALEKSKTEGAFARTIKNASLNFIIKYWIYILIFIILFIILFKIFYKKIRIFNLVRNLERMNTELKVLNDLIIKAQIERYKDNRLSGIVYNIRVKKYKERMSLIHEQIPVLEARLKKLLKKK